MYQLSARPCDVEGEDLLTSYTSEYGMDSQSGKARWNALVVVVNQPATLPVLRAWCQLEDFSASHANSVAFVQDFMETITTQGGKRQATRGRRREESDEKESDERKATRGRRQVN